MTRIRELPDCNYRFGRTNFIESEDGKKKTAKFVLCCGYREVEPEECIMCTGYTNNVKFEFEVISFMKFSKDLRFKSKKWGNI